MRHAPDTATTNACRTLAYGPLPDQVGDLYLPAGRGDEVRFVELDGAGHMDFVEPTSAACAVLFEWLRT